MTDKDIRILIISSDERVKEVLNFCFDGWGYKVSLLNGPVEDILPVKKISPDVIVIDVQSAHKHDLNLCRLLKDDFATALIPVITIINKRYLRDHLLNLKHGVDDYVIKPPDPLDLRVRIEMAIRRAHYNLYASSLTGLPGGRMVEETVRERLKKNQSFSFAYLDIDSFKYFNDMYGYLKGDNVILQTAYILYSVIRQHGNKDDFIGHIGGDDFVFISTPDKCGIVAEQFIIAFDRVIGFHYGHDDRRKGFIIARDRTHTIARVPLMSISIAIVNRDVNSVLNTPVEINDRITEIKKYLKGITGSKYMIDRRDGEEAAPLTPQNFKRPDGCTRPLGQILIDKHILTAEQLSEILCMHWKKGVILGEILKELNIVKEKDLQDILQSQAAPAAGDSPNLSLF